MKAWRAKASFLTDGVTPEDAVANWLRVVSAFHENYRQINKYVNVYDLNRLSIIGNQTIRQCPVSQLTDLLVEMQDMLQQLLTEMDQTEQVDPTLDCKKLADHTLILDELNDRAETMLCLLSLHAP